MVVYNPVHNGRGRTPLSRDEIVERGERAERRAVACAIHPGPWIYKPKVKSGRRKTHNTEYQAWNKPHLFGMLVLDYARGDERLNVYSVKRVMKMSLRSNREDF